MNGCCPLFYVFVPCFPVVCLLKKCSIGLGLPEFVAQGDRDDVRRYICGNMLCHEWQTPDPIGYGEMGVPEPRVSVKGGTALARF